MLMPTLPVFCFYKFNKNPFNQVHTFFFVLVYINFKCIFKNCFISKSQLKLRL